MEHLTRQERLRALAALAVAVVLWASAFVAIRFAVRSYGPGHLSLLRIGVAALLLAAMAAFRPLKLPRRRDAARFLLLGATGMAAYQVLLNAGERTVSAGVASLLVSCAPILASLGAVAFLGERLSVAGWAGTATAFAGATVIALGANGGLSLSVGRGTLLVVVATCVWATFLVVQKPLAARHDSFELTAYPMWAGALMLLPFAPGLPRAVAAAPPAATGAVAFLAAFSSVAGFLAWAYAISRLDVVVAGTALYLVPVVALLVGWALLAEAPGATALAGGGLALAGVALVQLKGRPAA